MKVGLIIFVLFAGISLYSCSGGSSSENNSSSDSVSNAGSASETMDNNTPSIDVNAPSASKGVGKFTDVKIGAAIDPAMAAKGQEVFETKCTACHQATDKKLIGPGLKGISKIRTPEWIMNMMTNPDEMTHKDPVAMALYDEFNHTQMTNQGLSDEEARQVLEFFRKNDSQ